MGTSLLAHSQRAFELAEASGISCKPGTSKFVEKVFTWLKAAPEHADVARRLTSALERVLDRSHEDSRLILTLCYTLQECSELDSSEFQKKLARAIRYLEKPAASAVVKTMKQAALAEVHSKVLDIQDLDAIAALGQAPRDMITPVEGDSDLLQIGSETIHLTSSNKKEIQAAVKKVKAEAKKAKEPKEPKEPKREDDAVRDTAAIMRESLEQVVDEIAEGEPSFSNELDEAALALANLLKSLPREGALSNLASVIEEAKTLLEITKERLFLARRSNIEDVAAPDLH